MPTEHEKLIGAHPLPDANIIGSWLTSEDLDILDSNPNKKHRKLSEKIAERSRAVEEIANWIVEHHVDANRLIRLQRRKSEIMSKYGISIEEYVDSQNLFPKLEVTKRGSATEIILTQYLQTTSGLSLLAYKLTYNANIDQSMKGDDCLLFNTLDLRSKIIVGEAKFRSTPSKKVVMDMIENLEGNKKLPISLPFIAQLFSSNGDEDMAGKIDDLLYEVSKGQIPIVNVGLLLSTKGTTKSSDSSLAVEANLTTTNPNLVIISLGTENPKAILDDAFDLAKNILIEQI
ncbi:Hachiman antiphage defense system protein HamA [Sphingobacterium siyangense]|uniref:Hachiman antiphage defense system protein HamA n=1 Tax=Sphingobacterium siyangense TaxID=459529 RepID=UPI002FD8ECF9